MLRRANRRTHQCWPSYRTIGTATQLSVNTAHKHVCTLSWRRWMWQLIVSESHKHSHSAVTVRTQRDSLCAAVCLSAIRKVTSRRSPQTQSCQKRVACVCHPANSAEPKVTGEPRGRKMCRIKAGGRLRVLRPATSPRRAGRGRSGGGHFSPPGVMSGVCFSSTLTAVAILTGPSGDMRRI